MKKQERARNRAIHRQPRSVEPAEKHCSGCDRVLPMMEVPFYVIKTGLVARKWSFRTRPSAYPTESEEVALF